MGRGTRKEGGAGRRGEASAPGRGRAATSASLAALLLVFAVDALPAWLPGHAWLQDRLDPLVDVTGLWQGRWNLFAPTPRLADLHLTAELTYADGSVHTWRSPDWRAMGVAERARRFRHMEYFDAVAADQNRAAWPALALHLARTEGRARTDGAFPVRVDLFRHRVRTPPPGPGLLARVDGAAGVADPPERLYTCWPAP